MARLPGIMGSLRNAVLSLLLASFSNATRYRSAASVRCLSRFWTWFRRSCLATSRSNAVVGDETIEECGRTGSMPYWIERRTSHVLISMSMECE